MTGTVKAVDGISIKIMPGQTYSLVGESGCGKTTTSRMVLMADRPTEGSIYFDNRPASVQAVFQDPWSSLNPRMRVDQIISEPLVTHRSLSRAEVRSQVQELLQVVGLHPFHAERYPHEFSGGQRQRIAIARALSTRPKLIVLDEPVSALDVSIRAQILNLLKELQSTYNLSYLLIAHNLATVRYMSHTVGVMYLGKIVEESPPAELFTNAQHPYTRALISASLPAHPRQRREEIVLAGEVPSPLNPPGGCTFHPRCPFVMERCSVDIPLLKAYSSGHMTACHLYEDGVPVAG
ncbi:Oligopeptide transport ATP-binding protein AppF [Geodia barretti]|uniref:Oligopeptide transport ATP-binding protein AppF n=1 Tax=Geodia barretti TaxID=519541 RepID=A0AA35WR59_GEOBA|nr:Oligopeptide transport ATP-binding protein AppF [Geodia barretti]